MKEIDIDTFDTSNLERKPLLYMEYLPHKEVTITACRFLELQVTPLMIVSACNTIISSMIESCADQDQIEIENYIYDKINRDRENRDILSRTEQ
jgi:hypothetical protein